MHSWEVGPQMTTKKRWIIVFVSGCAFLVGTMTWILGGADPWYILFGLVGCMALAYELGRTKPRK